MEKLLPLFPLISEYLFYNEISKLREVSKALKDAIEWTKVDYIRDPDEYHDDYFNLKNIKSVPFLFNSLVISVDNDNSDTKICLSDLHKQKKRIEKIERLHLKRLYLSEEELLNFFKYLKSILIEEEVEYKNIQNIVKLLPKIDINLNESDLINFLKDIEYNKYNNLTGLTLHSEAKSIETLVVSLPKTIKKLFLDLKDHYLILLIELLPKDIELRGLNQVHVLRNESSQSKRISISDLQKRGSNEARQIEDETILEEYLSSNLVLKEKFSNKFLSLYSNNLSGSSRALETIEGFNKIFEFITSLEIDQIQYRSSTLQLNNKCSCLKILKLSFVTRLETVEIYGNNSVIEEVVITNSSIIEFNITVERESTNILLFFMRNRELKTVKYSKSVQSLFIQECIGLETVTVNEEMREEPKDNTIYVSSNINLITLWRAGHLYYMKCCFDNLIEYESSDWYQRIEDKCFQLNRETENIILDFSDTYLIEGDEDSKTRVVQAECLDVLDVNYERVLKEKQLQSATNRRNVKQKIK